MKQVSPIGRRAGRLMTWGGGALVLTLLLLTGAGWASRDARRPSVGKPAPVFTLTGLNSKEPLTLSDLRGRVVLVDFWASWCLPCRQLMPQMAALQEQNPDLVVVAVSVDASREKALTFLRAVEPTLRAVHDADHKVADAYGVERMPSSFLIDRNGKLRFRHDGYGPDDMEAISRHAQLLLEEIPE